MIKKTYIVTLGSPKSSHASVKDAITEMGVEIINHLDNTNMLICRSDIGLVDAVVEIPGVVSIDDMTQWTSILPWKCKT